MEKIIVAVNIFFFWRDVQIAAHSFGVGSLLDSLIGSSDFANRYHIVRNGKQFKRHESSPVIEEIHIPPAAIKEEMQFESKVPTSYDENIGSSVIYSPTTKYREIPENIKLLRPRLQGKKGKRLPNFEHKTHKVFISRPRQVNIKNYGPYPSDKEIPFVIQGPIDEFYPIEVLAPIPTDMHKPLVIYNTENITDSVHSSGKPYLEHFKSGSNVNMSDGKYYNVIQPAQLYTNHENTYSQKMTEVLIPSNMEISKNPNT